MFVDLRKKTEGRWELEVPPEEEEAKEGGENGEEGQSAEGEQPMEEEEEEEEEDEAYIRRNRCVRKVFFRFY